MACLGGSLAPRSDCTLQLAECFDLGAGERGATREVWSKGNEALVFDAPKNVSGITASVGHGGNSDLYARTEEIILRRAREIYALGGAGLDETQ
jgi:hypothetical protein